MGFPMLIHPQRYIFPKTLIKCANSYNHVDRFEVKVDGCDHKLTIKDAELGDADEYTAQLNEKTSTKAKLTVEGKILPEYNLLWPILTSLRFLICENFQKYNLILFPNKTFKYIITTDSEFKDAFENCFEHFVDLFSLLKKNFSQNKNRSLVRISL